MSVRFAFLRPVRRFRRDRDGVSALEFALVATPFFALLMATLEAALFFFTQTIIEDGLQLASRDLRTGVFQTTGGDEEAFRDALCARIDVVADCAKISIDIRTFDDFSSTDFAVPTDAEGNLDDSGFSFQPGGAGDVVLVRAFYPYQLFMPNIAPSLADLPGNKKLIAAAVAFRNEPFAAGGQ